MTDLKISISYSKDNQSLEYIGDLIVGETWERISKLNLCKPKKDQLNIVVIDEIIDNDGTINRTEIFDITTAEWLLCEFWKVKKVWDKIEMLKTGRKHNNNKGGHKPANLAVPMYRGCRK